MAYAPDLSRLLTAGARYADEHDEYVIEPHSIGDVVFPTGQVVGSDPLTADDAEPFTVRVAALQLVVRDVTAVRALAGWEYEQVEDVYIAAQLPEWPVPGAAGAVTDEPSGANVILVSSGWGDGAYPAFVGYAAPSEVSSFVTDFMVVPAG